jgi:hypothetical protein
VFLDEAGALKKLCPNASKPHSLVVKLHRFGFKRLGNFWYLLDEAGNSAFYRQHAAVPALKKAAKPKRVTKLPEEVLLAGLSIRLQELASRIQEVSCSSKIGQLDKVRSQMLELSTTLKMAAQSLYPTSTSSLSVPASVSAEPESLHAACPPAVHECWQTGGPIDDVDALLAEYQGFL